jgi:hypothetical protein
MSDTAPRNPTGAPQMLADALLRSVGGTSAQLRISATSMDGSMSEVGLVANQLAEAVLSPVAMRKLRPRYQEGGQSQWELLISASSVEQQVSALDVGDAESLFAMTLTVTVDGQDYLIESVASNEAFGQVYLYRLLLRDTGQKCV